MHETLKWLTDGDLLFMTDVLASGSDRSRMLRVLREDEEILRGMLADERLFERILGEPEGLLEVSPRLLFLVLLARVRRDLEGSSYTVEAGRAVVFDVPRIVSLLEDTRIADYLVEVLSSFARVHATSVTVRLRRGVWARYRFSDLDLPGMIRYTATLEEEARSAWYRRIGDLCLFRVGVFPDSMPAGPPAGGLPDTTGPDATRLTGAGRSDAGVLSGGRRLPHPGALSRSDCVEKGRSAYRAASQHPRTEAATAAVLGQLADAFELALKPLDHMASRYLRPIRSRLFGAAPGRE